MAELVDAICTSRVKSYRFESCPDDLSMKTRSQPSTPTPVKGIIKVVTARRDGHWGVTGFDCRVNPHAQVANGVLALSIHRTTNGKVITMSFVSRQPVLAAA